MPKRYPFFNEEYIPPNKYRKMFIKKWYLILYQIQEDVVYVDYILDYRKDYQWLDKQRVNGKRNFLLLFILVLEQNS